MTEITQEKLRARVTFYSEKLPFNFPNREPPAIIMPFQSEGLPTEYQNWSLVAEKESEVEVAGGRRFCYCRVSYLAPEAAHLLKPGLTGIYINGKQAVASVEVL
jgi:hypothetical protein